MYVHVHTYIHTYIPCMYVSLCAIHVLYVRRSSVSVKELFRLHRWSPLALRLVDFYVRTCMSDHCTMYNHPMCVCVHTGMQCVFIYVHIYIYVHV